MASGEGMLSSLWVSGVQWSVAGGLGLLSPANVKLSVGVLAVRLNEWFGGPIHAVSHNPK